MLKTSAEKVVPKPGLASTSALVPCLALKPVSRPNIKLDTSEVETVLKDATLNGGEGALLSHKEEHRKMSEGKSHLASKMRRKELTVVQYGSGTRHTLLPSPTPRYSF